MAIKIERRNGETYVPRYNIGGRISVNKGGGGGVTYTPSGGSQQQVIIPESTETKETTVQTPVTPSKPTLTQEQTKKETFKKTYVSRTNNVAAESYLQSQGTALGKERVINVLESQVNRPSASQRIVEKQQVETPSKQVKVNRPPLVYSESPSVVEQTASTIKRQGIFGGIFKVAGGSGSYLFEKIDIAGERFFQKTIGGEKIVKRVRPESTRLLGEAAGETTLAIVPTLLIGKGVEELIYLSGIPRTLGIDKYIGTERETFSEKVENIYSNPQSASDLNKVYTGITVIASPVLDITFGTIGKIEGAKYRASLRERQALLGETSKIDVLRIEKGSKAVDYITATKSANGVNLRTFIRQTSEYVIPVTDKVGLGSKEISSLSKIESGRIIFEEGRGAAVKTTVRKGVTTKEITFIETGGVGEAIPSGKAPELNLNRNIIFGKEPSGIKEPYLDNIESIGQVSRELTEYSAGRTRSYIKKTRQVKMTEETYFIQSKEGLSGVADVRTKEISGEDFGLKKYKTGLAITKPIELKENVGSLNIKGDGFDLLVTPEGTSPRVYQGYGLTPKSLRNYFSGERTVTGKLSSKLNIRIFEVSENFGADFNVGAKSKSPKTSVSEIPDVTNLMQEGRIKQVDKKIDSSLSGFYEGVVKQSFEESLPRPQRQNQIRVTKIEQIQQRSIFSEPSFKTEVKDSILLSDFVSEIPRETQKSSSISLQKTKQKETLGVQEIELQTEVQRTRQVQRSNQVQKQIEKERFYNITETIPKFPSEISLKRIGIPPITFKEKKIKLEKKSKSSKRKSSNLLSYTPDFTSDILDIKLKTTRKGLSRKARGESGIGLMEIPELID